MIQGQELASAALLTIAAAAVWLEIAFFDALPPAVVGPCLLRFVRTASYMTCTNMHLQCFPAAGDLERTDQGLVYR